MEKIEKFSELKNDTEKLARMLDVYSMLHAEHTKLEEDFTILQKSNVKFSQQVYDLKQTIQSLNDKIQELQSDKESFRNALDYFIENN